MPAGVDERWWHMQTQFHIGHRCQGNIHRDIWYLQSHNQHFNNQMLWNKRERLYGRWCSVLCRKWVIMMKKVFILFYALVAPGIVFGACTETKTYSSCNAGYGYNSSLKNCALCQQGYYKATAGATSCTRCPSSGGVYGTTDSTGSKAITDCYIPAATSISDTSGTYQFTDDCYYKN